MKVDVSFLKNKGDDFMTTFLLKFIKGFVIKYFSSIALEKIVIIILGALVKRTDSKVDDKLFEAVFYKTEAKA